MRGNVLENCDDYEDPDKLDKFLNWEVSNIKACGSDKKIRGRLFKILSVGIDIGVDIGKEIGASNEE